MRSSRPRLTIRWLMIVVVGVATSLFAGKLVGRRKEFRQEAMKCQAGARYYDTRAERIRRLAQTNPGQVALTEEVARRCDRIAAYYRRWEGIWRMTEAHPWRARPAPEPPPE